MCRQEREMELRRQALEDERRRREQLERRLQDETARRQKLVEKEVKLREKHFSQVRGGLPHQCGVASSSLAGEADPAPRWGPEGETRLSPPPAGFAGLRCFSRLVP